MMSHNVTKTDQGKAYYIAGGTYTIVVPGSQTNNAYAVIDMLVPPGGGPGPHAHKDIQESFYVLEGEVVFQSDSGSFTALPGALVNIPLGGAVHGFKNKSAAHARLLCTVAPAGLDAFFSEIGVPVEAGVAPPVPGGAMTEAQRERLFALGEQYGQQFFPPDYFEQQ